MVRYRCRHGAGVRTLTLLAVGLLLALALRAGPQPSLGRSIRGRRVPLGRSRGRQLYLPPRSSLLVVGPTQSGKTSSVAIPAIATWEGPVVAASVKSDLLLATASLRAGPRYLLDPGRSTGLEASSWSPLTRAVTRRGSREVVADLLEGVRSSQQTSDAEFWLSVAGRLLAPLLQAAAISGCGVEGAISWVDRQDVEAVADVLASSGEAEAEQAWLASWSRDERILSSALATSLTVLEPVSEVGAGPGLDPGALLDQRGTAYLCAPMEDQRRYAGLFVAVLRDIIGEATRRSVRLGRPLDPPLLCVLDEAAAIAPLPELDSLAATLAGQGVVLLTVIQDLAQLRARYGERAGTVLSNHASRLFLPGIADPATLEVLSSLVGPGFMAPRLALRRAGPKVPPDASALRTLPRGRAVLVQSSHPALRVRLVPRGGLTRRGLALRSWLSRTPSSWPGRRQEPSSP